MSLWIDNQVTKYMVCNNVPIYNEDSHVTQEFEVEVEDNYIQITILEPSSVSGWNEGFNLRVSKLSAYHFGTLFDFPAGVLIS